jgi:hypothetical protein
MTFRNIANSLKGFAREFFKFAKVISIGYFEATRGYVIYSHIPEVSQNNVLIFHIARSR